MTGNGRKKVSIDVTDDNPNGVIYVNGDAENPQVNDERIRAFSIYVVFERYSGSDWVETQRIGGSIYVPRFLEIIKDINAEIILNDAATGQIRNFIKTATFSNGTVIADIWGDTYIHAKDKLLKVKPIADPAWYPIQPVDAFDSVGTSFYYEMTTSDVDGLASIAMKLKGIFPAGVIGQGKIFKQSDLVTPIWQSVTDFEFAQGIGTPVDIETGIIDIKPTAYLVGNYPLRFVFNFSEEVTLKGASTDGTQPYFESQHSYVKFENIMLDNVEPLTADATHIDNAEYLVHTTGNAINITIPFAENSTFTVRDADANFGTNPCNVLIKDSEDSLLYTVILNSADQAFFFYHDGTYWNYSKDGAGKTYQITSNRDSSADFPSSGGSGYWKRTGSKLEPVNAGDDISTTGALNIGTGTLEGQKVLIQDDTLNSTTTMTVKNANPGDASATIQALSGIGGIQIRAWADTGSDNAGQVWVDGFNNTGDLVIKSHTGIEFRTGIHTKALKLGNDGSLVFNDDTRDRSIINSTANQEISPDGLSFSQISNAGLLVNVKSSDRFAISATETGLWAADGEQKIILNNTGVGLSDKNRGRVAFTPSETDVVGPDGTQSIRVSDSNVIITGSLTGSMPYAHFMECADFTVNNGTLDVVSVTADETDFRSPDGSKGIKLTNSGGIVTTGPFVVEDGYVYLGDPNTNGTIKIWANNNGIDFDLRASGVYNNIGRFAA
ncbi:hypothetical protein KAR91_02220 [Candidatus Pacearchaeota archaeon]|nr:hypothetical protein [Candidatus Pacearchaeota archaeon]